MLKENEKEVLFLSKNDPLGLSLIFQDKIAKINEKDSATPKKSKKKSHRKKIYVLKKKKKLKSFLKKNSSF